MRMSLLAGCVALLSTSAMAAEPSPAFPAEPEHGFPSALAPAYITDLQQQLTAHGYYAGPLDGRMNGALRAAVPACCAGGDSVVFRLTIFVATTVESRAWLRASSAPIVHCHVLSLK